MYTGAGDKGTTSLIGGGVVPKSNLRVSCYGTLDELNAAIGMVRAQRSLEKDLDMVLGSLQKNLFTIGAILANPMDAKTGRDVQFDAVGETRQLESIIDRLANELPPLHNFILPTGTKTASMLHFARTVARRAERLLVALNETEPLDMSLLAYLNRVSSALFVFARYINFKHNVKEENW